ncbi:hypothetical protein GSI_07821 [Ganoderma sinense ZZ0214-1]|uniref:Uncharacterized protein n=1 Tax=Ganoderma sinense ZZ0214-1 TaxID=1077348 RepID=A0A2G8S827_9APHY|nr:hypothetical protein GSI_07821 [Ganoderma sinense ZZ0214-1]
MVAETQVTLDPHGSMRRHPGQQRPYSPFALAALPKRTVWPPARAGAGDWAQASVLRCSLCLRTKLRQPGCDRDEYPPSASPGAGRGESTDAITWNVACNEPWVGDGGSLIGVASPTGSFFGMLSGAPSESSEGRATQSVKAAIRRVRV